MNEIKIKGGSNFNLKFSAEKNLTILNNIEEIAINNKGINNIKPKILVKIGDEIIKGQELFYDKNNPNIKFVSPNNGIVKSIEYGERRKLEYIVIKTNDKNKYINFGKINENEINKMTKKEILKKIINSGYFKNFINFPNFEKLNTEDEENFSFNNLYISLFENQPLLKEDIEFIIEKDNNIELIIHAINIIKEITNNIDIFYPTNNNKIKKLAEEIKKKINKINIKEIENKYPSSDFRLQYIYNNNIFLNNKKIKCTGIDVFSLIELGFLFKNGYIKTDKYYSISGNGIEKRKYILAPIGINIREILNNCIKTEKEIKIITKGLMLGELLKENDFLNYNENNIQIIKEDKNKTPFVFFRLGNNCLTRTKIWLSGFNKEENFEYDISNSINGEHRACIQCNYCNEICPSHIFPSLIMKASLIKDIEKLENLYIYNCIECELCTFICPSKIEICKTIKLGKTFIHNAG